MPSPSMGMTPALTFGDTLSTSISHIIVIHLAAMMILEEMYLMLQVMSTKRKRH